MNRSVLEANAKKYAEVCGISLDLARLLGDGTDGVVWKSGVDTAIKALESPRGYYNERDSYLRLQEYGVTERLEGFWLPRIIGYDDQLLVVEMDVISGPPYILDFAKVRIDRPPEFSEDTLADFQRRGVEWWGERWPEVLALLDALESFGIYYLDPRPGNIVFLGDDVATMRAADRPGS
jgi:hypothetical protein